MEIGLRATVVLSAWIIMIGQLIFCLGSSFTNINIMIIGRVVLGFGGECIQIPLNSLIMKWFKKKELGFSMGLSISLCRLANISNDLVTPRIAHIFVYNT